MGKNSIQSNRTKEDILAEIKMSLGADFNHEKVFVVVEGTDDIQFFNKRLEDNVELCESFSGKEGVKEIVDFFSEKRVVGICDKDYEINEPSSNILFYDYSCLEMMLISNQDSFKSFARNFYYGDLSADDLRLKILEDIKWVSFFRKLNSINAWGVRLNGISFATAYDNVKKIVSLNSIIQQLGNHNPGVLENNRNYLVEVSSLAREEYDVETYLNITQGHDFISYSQTLFNSYIPKKGISKETLFGGLCCAFGDAHFKLTKLYTSLKKHSEIHNIRIIA